MVPPLGRCFSIPLQNVMLRWLIHPFTTSTNHVKKSFIFIWIPLNIVNEFIIFNLLLFNPTLFDWEPYDGYFNEEFKDEVMIDLAYLTVLYESSSTFERFSQWWFVLCLDCIFYVIIWVCFCWWVLRHPIYPWGIPLDKRLP